MPKVKSGNKYNKFYTEEALQQAINAVNKGISQYKASSQFGIPRSTLQFRLSENFVKSTHGPPPVLTNEEEENLVKWIIEGHRKGFARKKENVQTSVKNFLDKAKRKTLFINNIPGDGWYRSFLKRHPSLIEKQSDVITNTSSNVNQSDIFKWFKQIEGYLTEEDYLNIIENPTRIFHCSKAYLMVYPKLKNIIATNDPRNLNETDGNKSKSNLTILLTFSANGEAAPPMIVYPYKRLPLAIGISVPDKWGIGATSNGSMNEDIFANYLSNVFHPYLIEHNILFPVILFIDDHSNYLTMQIHKLCEKLQIIIICLYPNSSRILQQADVAAFKPFTVFWNDSVSHWKQNNLTSQLTLDKIAVILQKVVSKYLENNKIITNGFKACGLYPFNVNAIDYTQYFDTVNNLTIPNKVNHQKIVPKLSVKLSFDSFKSIVGHDLIQELESLSDQSVLLSEKNNEFIILHKLFCEYRKRLKN